MFSETLKQSILQLVRRRRRSYSHETRGLKRLPLLKIELFWGLMIYLVAFFVHWLLHCCSFSLVNQIRWSLLLLCRGLISINCGRKAGPFASGTSLFGSDCWPKMFINLALARCFIRLHPVSEQFHFQLKFKTREKEANGTARRR